MAIPREIKDQGKKEKNAIQRDRIQFTVERWKSPEINNPHLRRWTPIAIFCFERNMICPGCIYHNMFIDHSHCKMKFTVLDLVKFLGLPKKRVDF